MQTNHTVTGKVPWEVIDKLFNIGDLANPEKIEKSLNTYRKNKVLSEHRKWTKEYYAFPKWRQFLYERPTVSHRDSSELDMPLAKWLGRDNKQLQEIYYASQDIRKVLEVLSVAKNSAQQGVWADNVTLITLKRVIDKEYWYVNLDLDLEEILESL